MPARKTWLQKLDNGREPKVVRTDKDFAGVPAGSDMLVSTPREVDTFLRKIKEGVSMTPAQVRDKLARKHHADASCPVSTGIFLRIAADAAWEEIGQGKDPSEVTPFWRVVEPGSALARKLSCGEAFLIRMRRQEGIA